MDIKYKYIVFIFKVFLLGLVSADIYSVKIGTEQHVNVVDPKFLSFTVDPKYLFTSDEKYNSKESVCMASSLTPAYIRIAGPSTARMLFRNTTITFTDLDRTGSGISRDSDQGLEVTHRQWKNFVQWAKKTGFDLVFAINNEEKTEAGLWDPNPALNILSVADKANVSDIFWQLGYECTNETIEEYLNDLETLRLIVETFPRVGWRVVGGDVTGCLRADSKSDFKDYVVLSDEMLDAVLLNGNSSAQELERMSETDRLKLLKRLSQSTTPLWLTESPQHFQQFTESPQRLTERRTHKLHFHTEKSRLSERFHRHTEKAKRFGDKSRFADKSRFTEMSQRLSEQSQLTEMYRAADWMTSLGYSAKNGFAVHFRELIEDELYEPTLSFYMALLFKNLVGERVLPVDMEASEAILFAHCTSLRHKAVPGAVTLFGANLDDEPARFSVKLSRREEGGDIMQFILGHDLNGNIIVNGRAMYYEGDIRPVVKRVRPYKTLLLTLPPKSFGFWVLANTKVEACHYEDTKTSQEFVEAISASDETNEAPNSVKTKRSMLTDGFKLHDEVLFERDAVLKTNSEELKQTIDDLNNELKNVHELFRTKADEKDQRSRVKRHVFDEEQENAKRKLRRPAFKHKFDRNGHSEEESRPKLNLIKKLFGTLPKLNSTRLNRLEKGRKLNRLNKNKVNKRHLKPKVKPIEESSEEYVVDENKLKRKRRSILDETHDKPKKKITIHSIENEVDPDIIKNKKLWKILHKIHEQIQDLPADDENVEYTDYSSNGEEYKDEDQITVKTKLTDDGTTIKYSEKSKRGLLKSTVGNVVSVLSDLNHNLNRFWNALTLFE